MVRILIIGAALLVAAGGQVEAQGTSMMGSQVSQITVTARGEVAATPDRARVQLGVETRAKTAALAAQENARKQGAVLKAIQGLGIKAAQITTMGYSVAPMQHWDDKLQRAVVDGYEVRNIVQVETDVVEQAGTIIDAALGAGANRVAGLDFLLRDPSAAQDRALEEAVKSARRQAEVAARAAGGSVAGVLEITVQPEGQPQGPMVAMARMAAADAAPTPVSAGTQTVAVSVYTRWRFEKP